MREAGGSSRPAASRSGSAPAVLPRPRSGPMELEVGQRRAGPQLQRLHSGRLGGSRLGFRPQQGEAACDGEHRQRRPGDPAPEVGRDRQPCRQIHGASRATRNSAGTTVKTTAPTMAAKARTRVTSRSPPNVAARGSVLHLASGTRLIWSSRAEPATAAWSTGAMPAPPQCRGALPKTENQTGFIQRALDACAGVYRCRPRPPVCGSSWPDSMSRCKPSKHDAGVK